MKRLLSVGAVLLLLLSYISVNAFATDKFSTKTSSFEKEIQKIQVDTIERFLKNRNENREFSWEYLAEDEAHVIYNLFISEAGSINIFGFCFAGDDTVEYVRGILTFIPIEYLDRDHYPEQLMDMVYLWALLLDNTDYDRYTKRCNAYLDCISDIYSGDVDAKRKYFNEYGSFCVEYVETNEQIMLSAYFGD